MAWGHGNLGGGAAGFPIGMILVDYPENSTLTMTAANGGKFSKNDISSTRRMYYVKDYDTYTVTSVEKTTRETTSKTVVIRTLGQTVSLALSYALLLIDGATVYTSLTGSWRGLNTNVNSKSGGVTPSVASPTTSTPYYVLSQAQSNNSRFGIFTNYTDTNITRIDLTEYNFLILEYDIVGTGTYHANRKAFASLMACANNSTMYPANMSQNDMTYKVNVATSTPDVYVNPGNSLTNQKLVLDISDKTKITDTNKGMFISIGVNAYNDTCGVNITVKKLYAANSVPE